jgi:uncharacterized protein
MVDTLKQPWHWSIAGLLIGLIVPLLLLIGNKRFGISSTLRHICAICIPANLPFFKYNWRQEVWSLFFVAGITIGAFLAATFLTNPAEVVVAAKTKAMLAQYGITNFNNLMPKQIFNTTNIFTIKGVFFFVFGGFLVGFGTRYAGGCTSGHAITGLATLQWPSLIATCCFMVGGFFSANILVPLFLKLTN